MGESPLCPVLRLFHLTSNSATEMSWPHFMRAELWPQNMERLRTGFVKSCRSVAVCGRAIRTWFRGEVARCEILAELGESEFRIVRYGSDIRLSPYSQSTILCRLSNARYLEIAVEIDRVNKAARLWVG